jgi:outer membrane protein TolC
VTKALILLVLIGLLSGCGSQRAVFDRYFKRHEPVSKPYSTGWLSNLRFITTYQETMAMRGPQERQGPEGLDAILPEVDPFPPAIKDGRRTRRGKTIHLTLEDAVARTLANSPEITVVSFDPSIAKEGITVAKSEFDVTAFGQFGYDNSDERTNNVFETGQFESRLWEGGVKQKGMTGAEWRLAYALTRSADESVTRQFTTGYEPTLIFELKQPLLRDGWRDINLAGVNVADLNYQLALAAFRRKTEETATQVVSLYWALLQARRNVAIQKSLLRETVRTLKKVKDRKNIDASVGYIKQTEKAVKSREAFLYDTERQLFDVQDRLVRLLADHQMNLVDKFEIIPSTTPDTKAANLKQEELLTQALQHNPDILAAKLEVEVAVINKRVARKQQMPRLDLVGSAQLQGLSDTAGEAHEMVYDRDHTSYTLGVTLEYPLGNRERRAEYRLRELEHAKSLSRLQNVSDQIATLVKAQMRLASTAHKEIAVQKAALKAARIYLRSLEDMEVIRKNLTPEFLLAKLDAQESLADAQRGEIKAIVDYNIALTRLAQATGTVLDLRYVRQNSRVLATDK